MPFGQQFGATKNSVKNIKDVAVNKVKPIWVEFIISLIVLHIWNSKENTGWDKSFWTETSKLSISLHQTDPKDDPWGVKLYLCNSTMPRRISWTIFVHKFLNASLFSMQNCRLCLLAFMDAKTKRKMMLWGTGQFLERGWEIPMRVSLETNFLEHTPRLTLNSQYVFELPALTKGTVCVWTHSMR